LLLFNYLRNSIALSSNRSDNTSGEIYRNPPTFVN
jgi:hypothetical protein